MLQQKEQWIKTNSDDKNKHYQYKHKTIKSMFFMSAQLDDIPIKNFIKHVWDIDTRISSF